MFKKMLLIFAIICLVTPLCGCLNSIKLGEQALVQAVSIDLIEKKIRVGLQIFSPTNDSGSSVTPSPDNALIIEGVGDTLTQAVENAMLKQGKKIFLGHNRIVIVGKELAQQGMLQTLKYFSTNPMSRKNVSIAIADGKAIDLVKAKLAQGILPAQTLQNVIANTNETGYAENVLMYEFERSLQNRNECAILPVLKLAASEDSQKQPDTGAGENKQGQSDGKSDQQISDVGDISVVGCAILVEGKLIKVLGTADARGVLWLRKAVGKTSVVTQTDAFSLCAINIYKVDTKITPKIVGKEISFDMEISCSATLGEVHLRDTAIESDIKGAQIAAEKIIKEECENAFNEVIIGERADICNYGAMVWQNNVELWREIKDDWQNEVGKMKLNVTVNVDIDSVGLQFYEKR